MNSPINTTVQNASSIQTGPGVGSSMWINKLKIVGSGQNWAVAPCEPFYLMGTETPALDAALTGAKNLIEHYGLASAYQKFCSKPLREELSAFLPHLSGNVDVPASKDGSGLMALIERPPIRGKELLPFAQGQLEQAFRLHPGPLPAEYAALFAAAPQSRHTHRVGGGVAGQPAPDSTTSAAGLGSSSGVTRMPATAAPGLSDLGQSYPAPPPPPRRRRRYDAARGPITSAGGGASGFGHASNSFFPVLPPGAAPVSAMTTHSQVPSAPTSSSSSSSAVAAVPSSYSHPAHLSTSTQGSLPSSALAVDTGSAVKSVVDLPPGLIPVSAPPTSQFNSDHPVPPPPPLLAPVHVSTGQALANQRPNAGFSSGCALPGTETLTIPAPPVLHSIHPLNSSSASPGGPSHHHQSHHNQFGSTQVLSQGVEFQSYGRMSSPSRAGGSGSSPPSPDSFRGRRSDGTDAERRNKKKRKDKKRRKERE